MSFLHQNYCMHTKSNGKTFCNRLSCTARICVMKWEYVFRIRMCNVRCVCACMWFHVTILSKHVPRCVRKKLETRRGDGNEEKWNARQSERRRPTFYLMRSMFLVLILLPMMHAHSMNSEHVCMLSSVWATHLWRCDCLRFDLSP